MSLRTRILIADDHALLRAGLRALLSQEPDLEIVAEEANGRDAVRAAAALHPDLVLMDLSMGGMDGLEAIARIKRRDPQTRVLVVSAHAADEYVRESLAAGADGYLVKHAAHGELRVAVRTLLAGRRYVGASCFATDGAEVTQRDASWATLTQREREVLKLIAEGHPNKYISAYLTLSVKTVEKHRSNLRKKLNLHNGAMLTGYAIRNGLIER
jgi:DNA-binding NarL/FixJ family response regulator